MTASFGLVGEIKYCYVVFQESILWDRVRWLTSEGFRHCWAFHAVWYPDKGLLSDRYSMKHEVTSRRTDIAVWWASPDEVAASFLDLEEVTDILRVRVDIDREIGYIPRGMLTCVSGTKSLLGVRAWWVLTPKQLYRYLLENGAVSLKEDTQDGRSN